MSLESVTREHMPNHPARERGRVTTNTVTLPYVQGDDMIKIRGTMQRGVSPVPVFMGI